MPQGGLETTRNVTKATRVVFTREKLFTSQGRNNNGHVFADLVQQ